VREPLEFPRLLDALTEAIEALPLAACENSNADVQRECHETALLLIQARERVRLLQHLFEGTLDA